MQATFDMTASTPELVGYHGGRLTPLGALLGNAPPAHLCNAEDAIARARVVRLLGLAGAPVLDIPTLAAFYTNVITGESFIRMTSVLLSRCQFAVVFDIQESLEASARGIPVFVWPRTGVALEAPATAGEELAAETVVAMMRAMRARPDSRDRPSGRGRVETVGECPDRAASGPIRSGDQARGCITRSDTLRSA